MISNTLVVSRDIPLLRAFDECQPRENGNIYVGTAGTWLNQKVDINRSLRLSLLVIIIFLFNQVTVSWVHVTPGQGFDDDEVIGASDSGISIRIRIEHPHGATSHRIHITLREIKGEDISAHNRVARRLRAA